LVTDDLLLGVHDVADGGVLTALAEMAVRSGVGFDVSDLTSVEALFGEHPSRVIACVDPDRLGEVHRRHVDAGISATLLGTAGGERLVVEGVLDFALDDAVSAWRDHLPAALAGGTMQ
jgi:phosphoribosylformylglycinamidine synthase